jgi:ribosome-dependent ATPase
MLPATQFSGMIVPVSSLSGAARAIGSLFPMTYFLTISVGAFTKALDFASLVWPLLALASFIPVLTVLAILALPKQER